MVLGCDRQLIFNYCCCLYATLRGSLKMGWGLCAGMVAHKSSICLMQGMSLMLVVSVVAFAYG